MKITFALKEFFRDKASNVKQVNHFLLSQIEVEVSLVFEDSTEKAFLLQRNSSGTFILDLGPADIPDSENALAPPLKKRISGMSLDFRVPFRHDGATFQLLRVLQDFNLTPLPTNSDLNIDYELAPFSWKHSAFALTNRRTSPNRTANGRVHPLLDLSKLSKNLILVNALVVDVTELWYFLHRRNITYRVFKALGSPDKVTFKVFAHLGGNSFIWYSVVPAYLADASAVSPHVFFSPADYAEKQNQQNERKYLLDNREHFEKWSGTTLIYGYLLPPVDDDRIENLDSLPELDGRLSLDLQMPAPANLELPDIEIDKKEFLKGLKRRSHFITWVIRNRRNVVNFAYTSSKPRKIFPMHWSIGAGFEKAFYGLGKVKPQQFLLMPQPFGKGGVVKGRESDAHLKTVTDTIVDVLQTNTELLGRSDDELVAKDKMILSCYSESGWDLWKASVTNMDNIKAIIGIEPNSTNPKGRDIIPKLLKKDIKVFIIGRHQGFGNHYRPEIAKPLQDKIRFLPDEPRKVIAYQPDPDSNDFVKYRIARMTKADLDPLMLDGEKEILADLAKRGKTGKAAIPFILQDINNSDKLSEGGLTSIFYSHNFALTGGQDMTLADPHDFYNKPVTYRTFFQQAVEEIEEPKGLTNP